MAEIFSDAEKRVATLLTLAHLSMLEPETRYVGSKTGLTNMRIDWQLIESAPKDGTRIDLWMIDENGRGWRESNAYWFTDWFCEPYDSSKGKRDGWMAPNHDYDGQDGWCDEPPYFNTVFKKTHFIKATHWMPLPEPPK